MQPARVVTGTVSGQGQGGMMGAQAQGQGQGGYYSDVPAPAVMDAHATPQK